MATAILNAPLKEQDAINIFKYLEEIDPAVVLEFAAEHSDPTWYRNYDEYADGRERIEAQAQGLRNIEAFEALIGGDSCDSFDGTMFYNISKPSEVKALCDELKMVSLNALVTGVRLKTGSVSVDIVGLTEAIEEKFDIELPHNWFKDNAKHYYISNNGSLSFGCSEAELGMPDLYPAEYDIYCRETQAA